MKLRNLLTCFAPLALVGLSTVACTADATTEEVESSESKIVGGTEATPNAWPGTVAVYKGSFQSCGGSLIADEWVLTAAHCVTASSPTGGFSKIVAGRHNLTTTAGETLQVKKAFRHPSFSSSTLDNDIALIQLATKSTMPTVNLVDAVQAASVVAPSVTTVVGWGAISESGSSSNVLRQVDVPIIDLATCKSYSSYSRVTNNQFCAGFPTGGKDSCQGDSGGPLFATLNGQKTQVGVVSWGIGCARAEQPGVYTRVSNYLGWIAEKTDDAVAAAN